MVALAVLAAAGGEPAAHASLSPPCSVKIQGSMLPVEYAGQPRNNPDGTLYPGDSFYYLIWYSASPTCVGMSAAQLAVSGGLDTSGPGGDYVDPGSAKWFEKRAGDRCQKTTKYSGCVFGRATVNGHAALPGCLLGDPGRTTPGAPSESSACRNAAQSISQTVTALKLVCYRNGDGDIICYTVPVVRTVTLKPRIADAMLEVAMRFEALDDLDGYRARNLDGTYYAWDPITLRHEPWIKWKDDRHNTLRFEVTRHAEVRLEDSRDCHEQSCPVSMEPSGHEAGRWDLDNGAGVAIYNATLSDLGYRHFTYHTAVSNAGLVIADNANTTGVLVPDYDPVYAEYPYPLLSDDKRTSYENRAAVALHYFGSFGGGPDDVPAPHEDRRSKVNGFHHAGYGLDPWDPVLFRDALSWSEAEPVTLEAQHREVQESRHPDAVPTSHNGTVPCETDPGTVMLVRAGYCRIYFDYPILGTVVGPLGPAYENATLFNTLVSDGFGGRDTTFLSHYEYRFPEALFHAGLRVISSGPNGTVNPVPLRVDVYPAPDILAQPLAGYLLEKVVHDTGDPGFGEIVSNSTYPGEYSESGIGEVEIKLRRVSSKFEAYGDGARDLSGLDIKELSRLYLANSKPARLAVPLDVGLGALSPVSVNVTAGDMTRTYRYDYADFGTGTEIMLNVARDNSLEVTRRQGSMTITPEPGFGPIARLYIDGAQANVTCGRTCVMGSADNSAAHIAAENAWGGIAEGTAPEFVPEARPGIGAFDPAPLALFVLIVIPAYVAYSRLRR